MTAALVATRLLQFLSACILCGAPLFVLYGLGRPPNVTWLRPMLRTAAAIGALAALGWLMAQAGLLFADPAQALSPASVWSVIADTGFGAAAAFRLSMFVLALALVAAPAGPRPTMIAQAALGSLAAASFAWTGHGAATEGAAGAVHTAADVLHLLAASVWIGALAALAALARRARREGGAAMTAGLAAFSGVGPAVVAALAASGLVNGWFMVGPAHIADLLATAYGRLLAVKLVLFAAMLGLAGLNRLVLTPRLAARGDVRGLRASLLAETALGVAVLAAVAWLGVLPPPAEG